MPTAVNDSVDLAYERRGDAAGETVVFVEGLAYGRWMWRWLADRLGDEFDLLLFDNRGTGESAEPEGPYTTEQMAGDLEAVLADASVPRAHVVGASMGGMIALTYALEYDRAATLSLLCTTTGGEETASIPEETLERMFDVPDELDEREAIRYKMEPAFTEAFWTDRDDLIADIVDWRLATDASAQARAWQAAAVEAFDVSERLGEIEVPALVLHGERDRVVPVGNGRLLADGLPDATFDTFTDRGSHLFFIERPGAVSTRIRQFVQERGAPSGGGQA